MDEENTNLSTVGNINSVILILIFVQLIVAFCIWIVLSFTRKRTHKWPGCCRGYPGVVDPVNFLYPSHRIIAALAFGAMTSEFITFWINGTSALGGGNMYANVITDFVGLILIVLLTALLYYPFFACMDAPISLFGYCLGSFYCDLSVIAIIYSLVIAILASKDSGNFVLIFVSGVTLIPGLTCISIVLVWYHYKMIRELIYICSMGQLWKIALLEKREVNNLYHHYVKKLLSKRKEHSWPCMRGFKYPFPFLVAMVICILIVYELTIVNAVGFVYQLDPFAEYFDSLELSSFAAYIRKTYAVFIISPFVSAALVTALLIHLAYTMRKHIKEIYSGARYSVVDIHLVKWPSFTVLSAVRYAGIQITAVIIAWILFWLVFTIFGLILVGLSEFPDIVGYIVYYIFMAAVFTATVYAVQLFITWLFFISNESNATNSIVIGNRRVFNSFIYIVLLYNILTGLVFTVIRLILAIGTTCIMLVRLDQPLMLKGWGMLDFGHLTYKRFMTMELLLGNPIMHVFIQSLLEANKKNQTTDSLAKHPKSKRAYNRWMVAYTLVRNEQLQNLTASNLKSECDFKGTQIHATIDSSSTVPSVKNKMSDLPYIEWSSSIDLQNPSSFT